MLPSPRRPTPAFTRYRRESDDELNVCNHGHTQHRRSLLDRHVDSVDIRILGRLAGNGPARKLATTGHEFGVVVSIVSTRLGHVRLPDRQITHGNHRRHLWRNHRSIATRLSIQTRRTVSLVSDNRRRSVCGGPMLIYPCHRRSGWPSGQPEGRCGDYTDRYHGSGGGGGN